MAERAAELGIEPGYTDYQGEYRHSPASTLREIVDALESGDALDLSPFCVKPGEELPFQGGTIRTEDGRMLEAGTHLPEDLPHGYHSALIGGQRVPRGLIVSPGTCHLPKLRTWGWAAQLYSMRSHRSWGIGDLQDLAELGRWTAGAGAGFILVNPLGAAGASLQPSPYSPSSRIFRNPLYLSVDELAAGDPELEGLAQEGRNLNSTSLIDRAEAYRIKLRVLEHRLNDFPGNERFDRFCADQGDVLEQFATFSALAEAQGKPWTTWPERLQAPMASGVESFKQEHAKRIRFHKWVQWLIDEQLAGAGRSIGVIQDLPVGVDPDGADAWMFRGAFAEGFEVGAPPDEFNQAGQTWGIAPLHPRSVSGPGLEYFTATLRSNFAHSIGLRIDHVMGLFRLFWIPEGKDPAEGAYVRYPVRPLLDTLAIESRRAEALVVGEDLGTVEPEVREVLRERQVLSYRLLLFEEDLETIPELSMAAVTTHDLPTIAGIWSGSDLDTQRRSGVEPQIDGMARMKERIQQATGMDGFDATHDVIAATYRRLGASPAMLVAVTLEDALGVKDRPNMPGTTDPWPNWSVPLPLPLEELVKTPRVKRVAEAVRSGRRNSAG